MSQIIKQIYYCKSKFYHHFQVKVSGYLLSDEFGLQKEIEAIMNPFNEDIERLCKQYSFNTVMYRYGVTLKNFKFSVETSMHPKIDTLEKTIQNNLKEKCPDKLDVLTTFTDAVDVLGKIANLYYPNYTTFITQLPFMEKFIETPNDLRIRKQDIKPVSWSPTPNEIELIEKTLTFLIVNQGFSFKIPKNLDHYRIEAN